MASSIEVNYATMKFALNSGTYMPAVGLGTYRIRYSEHIMTSVDLALEAGYRLFDTAAVYGNEIHLREAFRELLPKHGLEREDIFVTTKLAPSEHGGLDVVEKAYQKSLNNLGLDYVDLYLIHFPGTTKVNPNDVRNKTMREMTWTSLENLYDDGRINAIGVSNFTVNHLNELMANHSIVPAVNQVEWHPYYYQPELQQLCKEKDIVLQAYCSFGGTAYGIKSLLDDNVVHAIANKLDVTPAQLLLVWATQQDVAVIPKSTNAQRIKENITLNFRIPNEDMRLLNALGEHGVKYAWDPRPVV